MSYNVEKVGGINKMNIITYRTVLNDDKMCYLDRISSVEYAEEGNIDNSDKVVRLMSTLFRLHNMPEEYVDMLCYDTKMNLLGVMEVSHGATSACVLSVREVLQKALLCNASAILLVHNHPSGDVSPSKNDNDTYNSIVAGCNMVGLHLCDNIILGKQFQGDAINYYSYTSGGKFSFFFK